MSDPERYVDTKTIMVQGALDRLRELHEVSVHDELAQRRVSQLLSPGTIEREQQLFDKIVYAKGIHRHGQDKPSAEVGKATTTKHEISLHPIEKLVVIFQLHEGTDDRGDGIRVESTNIIQRKQGSQPEIIFPNFRMTRVSHPDDIDTPIVVDPDMLDSAAAGHFYDTVRVLHYRSISGSLPTLEQMAAANVRYIGQTTPEDLASEPDDSDQPPLS